MISNAGFEISKGEEGTPGSTRAWPPAQETSNDEIPNV